MFGQRSQRWADYTLAVCVTALVIVAREALSAWLGRTAPFLLFVAAVLIASLRGGLGPGLVATGLSAAASDFFFVPPIFSLRVEKLVHGADLLLFVIVGVLISSLCDKRLRLVRQLRQADRRKDDFLATLAHELRNPLAPISNALEVWPTVENDPVQLNLLRAMLQRQVRQIVRIIDDLMDVSRIVRGKIQLRRERIDLAAVVSGAVEAQQPFIKACGHQLSLALPSAPLYVDGDWARLVQVIGNVVHNAAKYTGHDGSIQVAVERKGQTAFVRVKDNGPGIRPQMLAKIFEMYRQVDGTLERSHGGLGIGLTLAKRLVELHQGTIEAKSDGPGKGSEFIITLPAISIESIALEQRPQRLSVRGFPPLPRHRILVVDDMEESATTLAALLRAVGQEASTASDGPTALEWIHEHKPDLVFLDIAIPGMDGYEIARRVRNWAFHDITLVALTGYGQEEDRKRAYAAGFDHYLTKPVNFETLHELLATLPDSSGRTSATDSRPQAIPSNPHAISPSSAPRRSAAEP